MILLHATSNCQSWGCILDEADGVGVFPITEALNLTSAVRGETTLSGQGMSVSANMTVIMAPTEAVFGGETLEEDEGQEIRSGKSSRACLPPQAM